MNRAWFALLVLFALPLVAQEPEASDDDAAAEVLPRVVPVFDPGSHTRSIIATAFSKDDSKLITVGEDATIQIWSVATGERLEILRLAIHGHEAGFNGKDWDVAAISHDGRFVAIGGAQKQTAVEGARPQRTKLLVIDLEKRTIRRIGSARGVVSALAFAPDNRLAAAFGRAQKDIYIFPSVENGQGVINLRSARVLKDDEATMSPWFIQFSPDGKRLFSTAGIHAFVLWDLDKGAKPTKRLDLEGVTAAACWSPDGKYFVRAWTAFKSDPHGLEVRTADGELVKRYPFTGLAPFADKSRIGAIAYSAPDNLLISTDDALDQESPRTSAIRFNLSTGKAETLASEPTVGGFAVTGALSRDGKRAALTVSMGLDTIIYRTAHGKIVSRCGAASPVPTLVGWSADGKPHQFAWSESLKTGRDNTLPTELQFGFDLTHMEPIADIRAADFQVGRRSAGDWLVKRSSANTIDVTKAGEKPVSFQGGNAISSSTLILRKSELPLFAWAERGEHKGRAVLNIANVDGSHRSRLLPHAIFARDLAASPDGRFLIASTGSHRLNIYATDHPPYPLLSFARVNGEWVAWTANGYYAASPGGEKMFGWSVSNGPDQFATFYPAEKFAKQFRRPELLARAIELGSIEKALAALETRSLVLPLLTSTPCTIRLLKQTGDVATVEVRAAPEVQGKPVTEMRLLLDGKPLSSSKARKTVAPGDAPTATWEVEVPSGSHELKLLARSEEGSMVSSALAVKAPKTPDKQPVLHRLCVGINNYDIAGLRLGAAARDAGDVYAALEQYCVGPNNRFGKTQGKLLTNEAATRDAVLAELAAIQKEARPGHLVVFMFAGHGVKQGDEYFLLTKESDPAKPLDRVALSGQDLRTAFAKMECPVLLVLDACHSAQSVRSLKPATDDLTRGLTDETAGVTVLAAAMSHEVASATSENGFFTAAFLKALKGGDDVPFDPYEHALYTHHLYSVVFSEVRKATNGRQNPFLNMPWTTPPLVLREMPQN